MVPVRLSGEASEGELLSTAALLRSSLPAVCFGVDMASGGALWVALCQGFLRFGAVLVVGSTVAGLLTGGVMVLRVAVVLAGGLSGESTRSAVT